MSLKMKNDILDALFRDVLIHNSWVDKLVSNNQIQQLFQLTKLGSTSANVSPVRFVFITSKEGKPKLATTLSKSNGDDSKLFNRLPRLEFDEACIYV